MKKEFGKFVIVGVFNTGHYYLWYLALLELFAVHYFLSHAVALIMSMIASYFLNVYFTYKVPFSWKSFFLFPLTQVGNIVIQSVSMLVLVEWLHLPQAIAPLVTLFITVPITYYLTRRILYVAKHPRSV